MYFWYFELAVAWNKHSANVCVICPASGLGSPEIRLQTAYWGLHGRICTVLQKGTNDIPLTQSHCLMQKSPVAVPIRVQKPLKLLSDLFIC